jgi:hypothetical protein
MLSTLTDRVRAAIEFVRNPPNRCRGCGKHLESGLFCDAVCEERAWNNLEGGA